MIVGSNILAGASGQAGYFLNRSVRLRSSASAYFSRTLTTPTNNKIWTWSAWVKRGKASGTSAAAMHLFGTGSGSNDAGTTQIYFDNENLVLGGYSTPWLKSNAVYRDPSAWYHIVVAWDNSNATTANRAKIYINGVEITYVTDNRASLSTTSTYGINQAVLHTIGAWSWNNGTFAQPEYYDGYLTEINFIDGQALTPSSFGEYNTITGVWQPKKYGGTYGTNGFYLNFNDNSAATAAAIGKDSSGNGNNWTPNNISVTAGVTYDSMTDVPTLTNATTANYCVINPLDVQNASSVAQGNQYISFSAVNYGHSRATQSIPDGSYWEVVAGGTNYLTLGVANSTAFSSFNWAGCWAIYQSDGKVYNNGAAITGVLATFTTNDVIGFAVKGNKLYIAKNNTWLNSGDPVAQTGYVASNISSEIFPYIGNGGGAAGTPSAYFNGGQRPFTYTPPTGFKALNTYNLPTPTIANGAKQFAATLYTGNHSTNAITNTINGFSMQPDFVWIKDRSSVTAHALFDSVRGVGGYLSTNNTTAQDTTENYAKLNSFNSNGFTLGASTLANDITNYSGDSFVAWQWKASNAAAVTNTSGSISSQVSANTSAGFSIVTYTGTGANATVGHGLGVAPKMIIVKERDDVTNWYVYHASIGNTGGLVLNGTNATVTSITLWNNTSPTSSVISLGNSGELNGLNDLYVAYCFSEIAGYSKAFSYPGNGSTDGVFVYTGFRPRWIMLKSSSTTTNWTILDTSMNPYNVSSTRLYPNLANAQDTNLTVVDILSNGFKFRDSNVQWNAASTTYIGFAIAESPFNYSLAR